MAGVESSRAQFRRAALVIFQRNTPQLHGGRKSLETVGDRLAGGDEIGQDAPDLRADTERAGKDLEDDVSVRRPIAKPAKSRQAQGVGSVATC